MSKETLPPWPPEKRISAVRALMAYCEAVEAEYLPVSKNKETDPFQTVERRKAKAARARSELASALAEVGVAVSAGPLPADGAQPVA